MKYFQHKLPKTWCFSTRRTALCLLYLYKCAGEHFYVMGNERLWCQGILDCIIYYLLYKRPDLL